jgi:hypothetical protein
MWEGDNLADLSTDERWNKEIEWETEESICKPNGSGNGLVAGSGDRSNETFFRKRWQISSLAKSGANSLRRWRASKPTSKQTS